MRKPAFLICQNKDVDQLRGNLLEEQSDQVLHCLLFNLHLFNKIP